MRAKGKSQKAKNKYLTIEFAGICALITRKASKSAEVWLPDVMKAAPPGQGTEHYASFIVRTEEAQKVVADSAVTVPAQAPEYAVWNLAATQVSFQSDVAGSVVCPSKPAGKHAKSIDKLADVWAIAKPSNITPTPPLTASVVIGSGELAALMPPFKGQKYVFFKGANPTAAELKAAKEYAWRFRLRIPFKNRVTVTLTKNKASRVLEFKQNTDAVIANLCQEVGSTRNHFYAYYGMVDGETFMKIKKKTSAPAPSSGSSWPNWEYCFTGRISEP